MLSSGIAAASERNSCYNGCHKVVAVSLRIHRVADDFKTRITYINKTLCNKLHFSKFTKCVVCVRCFVIIVISLGNYFC